MHNHQHADVASLFIKPAGCVQCKVVLWWWWCVLLQVLYVPDPEYVSSAGSSPSLSPISPLSPTSSEAELEKVTYMILHLLPKQSSGTYYSNTIKEEINTLYAHNQAHVRHIHTCDFVSALLFHRGAFGSPF